MSAQDSVLEQARSVRLRSDALVAALVALARADSIPLAHARLVIVHRELLASNDATERAIEALGIDMKHGIPPIIEHQEDSSHA